MIRRFIRNVITWIMRPDNIKWGNIGKNSFVHNPCCHDDYTNLVSIGDNTQILANSRIQLYPYLVDATPHIRIGNRCYIGFYFSILAGADIHIGDDVLIASNVLITSENHSIDPESSVAYMNQKLQGKSVNIGNGTWIGEKVVILPGVTIGKKCVVGAGSVVTKSIPDYSIAVGNPARVIKKYSFEEHTWKKVE